MLYDLVFVSFDNEGRVSYETIEQSIDLDYWNIRQWRRLYLLLEKRNVERSTSLEIRPVFHDETY